MPARPHSAFRLLLPFALVIVIATAVLSLTHARAQPLAATYMHGRLSVTIPYHSEREGSGRLVAEILDP